VAAACRQRDACLVCLRMACDIGQGLLYDAIDGGGNVVGQALLVKPFDEKLDAHLPLAAKRRNVLLQRGHQAVAVEARRAQIYGELVQTEHDLFDGGLETGQLILEVRRKTLVAAQQAQLELERGHHLPGLIVQFPRDGPAFGLLHLH